MPQRMQDTLCSDGMYGHYLNYKTINDAPIKPDATCSRCGVHFDMVVAERA